MLADKDNNFPIIFVSDIAHCQYVEAYIRRSVDRYADEIYRGVNIYYQEIKDDYDIKYFKQKIKTLIKSYLIAKKQISTFKFKKIDKVCVDIIDNDDIYLNKTENVKVKSILSKDKVIDYLGKEHLISDLYLRYL